MKKDCLVEFSAGANLNFFALYAFWEHVKFLRRSWKLLKSNRTKTKMYRLSLLCFRIRDKLWLNFRYSTWSNMFPKYHGPWYRFGFQASIHYCSIWRCSNIQGFDTPGWPVSNIPGGSPWPPNLHDLQASWGYWGERGAPTLPQQVPSRWNFYPNHTIDGSEIANNWYIYPPSSFLYKMGWVVRKIKWIYYKMGCTTPPGQLEGWCIFTISTDARFLPSTVGSGILHMDHLWSFSKTGRFVWSNRLPGIQIPVVFYFAFSDVI